MIRVPFLDLRAVNEPVQDSLRQAFDRVMNSSWYILGEEVNSFEKEWAAYCSSKYAVGVSNGLDALHLGLRALGVGPGDDVLVPSNTYIATWLAVSQTGARPVPVEPLESTYNIDPANLKKGLTDHTKAIVPVHLYGQPGDLDPIMEFAAEHDLAVLDDAAQCHGAKYKGKRIGGLTHATAWSFYPGKNLGALGDAGAVTSNNPEIIDRVRVLRNYGSRKKYHNEVVGFNCRLDEVQAAFLRTKLRHLDSYNQRRSEIVQQYLRGFDGLTDIDLPPILTWAGPVWHLFVIATRRRDDLQRHLAHEGVQTVIHYPIPPHLQPAYAASAIPEGSMPIAERLAHRVLSLPMGPHLSDEQVPAVIEGVRSFFDA